MAGRDVTGPMITALEADVYRSVLIGHLDIDTNPVIAWTGPGIFAPSGTLDPALDDYIFTSVAPFIELSDIEEDQNIGGPTVLTIAGHDLAEEALLQVIADKNQWRGRGAWLWLGLLDADEHSVVGNPVRIKTGVMTKMTVNRGEDAASVSVEIDRDLGNAKSAPYRWVDHTRFYPDDTWSTFVIQLANKPLGILHGNMPLDPNNPDNPAPEFEGFGPV